ncbi:uncharacterized protein TrAFT101_008695 [Trichoderma asperellum]|uniref:uncharacterized protein n=1 Tax=Trichoderma asperellum TaxID=101201 RepID=UPI003327C284|nr:hypothetical protein TrAFT101_008695 [Trichoderma asperellum]
MKILFFAFLLSVLLSPVRADGWDDFSNNLATDLAPFLALFGEQTTKQFLSESITVLDYYIFSIAPIGILTAVISAIRVCGTPSLRAFIGRAQEGGGDAEAELCSSTSRDVCELYNNGGIARVFGRPKILEVVYDPSTNGIYPCREFVKRRRDEWIRSDEGIRSDERNRTAEWNRTRASGETFAGESIADEAVADIFAPNLSLNIGIRRKSTTVSWAVAVSGTFLQVGVLAFAVVVTYYLKWEKDGNRPDSYACPMAIVGTLVEWGGMFLCALLVGKTSRKQVFHRTQQALDKQSTRNLQSTSSSIYWLQPGGQVLGDQVFDPFCHSDQDQPLLQYVTSWKKPSRSQDSELVLWVAVCTTIIGFVIQFVGLRGIHSSISVAQLGAMMVMSVARSALRMQRLKPDDNFLRQCPDEVVGHELDWLAMRIGRQDAPPDCQRRLLWRFRGARDNTYKITKELPSTTDDLDIASKLLAYRTRLAQLTQPRTTQPSATTSSQQFDSEMVQVREISHCLALAIESTINKIFSKSSKFQDEWKDHISMFWSFACDVVSVAPDESCKNLSQKTLYLQLTRGNLESPWKLHNKLELEGILGLWTWSLKSDPKVEKLQDQFTISRALEIPMRRIISTKNIRETGLDIWLGSEMPSIVATSILPISEHCDPSTIQYEDREMRFFGWHTAEPSKRHGSARFEVWSASTNSSLLSLCAQEVFGSFIVSIFGTVGAVDDVGIQETPYARLESNLMSEIMKSFTEARLGSREDALLCILPPMISQLKIPSAENVLDIAKKRANEHRRNGDWIKAEIMLKWAWHICIKSQPYTAGNNSQNHTDQLVQQAAIALGELYRWAMTANDMKSFSSDGFKWLSAQKSSRGQTISTAVGNIIDRYSNIENRVNQQRNNLGDDLISTLSRLTVPASKTLMTTEEKSKALCSAAALGWSEVVIALLELGASPDYKDGSKKFRTALSLAAESNSIDAVKELLRCGASPNSEDDYGRTPLAHASGEGHAQVVKILLDDPRVEPNATDAWEETPLSLALYYGHEAVAQLLLNTDRINVNARERSGKTALALAARKGQKNIVQLLLNTGRADINIKDNKGKTPLIYAAENGHEEIVELLQNYLPPPI